MKILYEDKYIIICEKPIGIQSQISSDGKDMPSMLEKHRRDKGEDGYVGVVHRLDTATGGAMIYAKDKSTAGKLSQLIQGDTYKKEYLAVVEGKPDNDAGELRDLLYHDKQKNKSYVVKKSRNGVKEAIANYRLVKTVGLDGDRTVSLVSVQLITGRTHQIRVQFASRGMSLLGDGKYGSRDNSATLALWASKLEIVHPVTNKKISVESCPPDIYPWTLF